MFILYFSDMNKKIHFILIFIFTSILLLGQEKEASRFPFFDTRLSMEERILDLVSRLTLEEKVLQMQNDAPAVSRLGIPAYNWWSECLHGVARNGIATVFPQAIGMAATWDTDLIYREADVISTEARAKHNENLKAGQRGIYQGLTFWSPNINIFRDPRWGRGQETYGEDPYLTGRIGVAFVKGLQGTDKNYFKVISTAKHFAVHSGPEKDRHKFDAWCSERDLYETYLPAFEALITEGKAYSVMGAYNRFWNKPCCASDLLLDEILRKKWGFGGYVVSDCGAIWDIYHGHNLQPDSIRASVLGVKAGCDLTCGDEYTGLVAAVKNGYISENTIDNSLKRLFMARFYLGMFDPDSLVGYARIPITENDREESRKLALKVALESIVLLKNHDNTLPLSKNIRKLLVTGPYADKINVLLGNYNGTPSRPVTILSGIRKKAEMRGIKVTYSQGVVPPEEEFNRSRIDYRDEKELAQEAIKAALNSDIVIFVGGISPDLEGEEMNVPVDGFSGGDRTSLDIPKAQQNLLEKLKETGKPVVLILTNGSALSVTWAKDNLPAIIESWYPGEEGGNAIAEVLFGEYNPAGRLPVTFYRSVNDLPPFKEYSMKNRTYKYFAGKPLWPFGYGLSFTNFRYGPVSIEQKKDSILLKISIQNTGCVDGDEVVQVYSVKPESRFEQPLKKLVAFKRVFIGTGKTGTFCIPVAVKNLRIYNPEKQDYIIEPGKYILQIGSSSENIRLTEHFFIKE